MKRLIVIIVVLVALVTWFILTSIERQIKDENKDTAKEKTTYGLVSERNVYGV